MRPETIGIIRRLHAATGNEVQQQTTTDDGLRIEVPLPAQMTHAARDQLLAALDDADDYGHTRTGDSEHVWAIVKDWDT